MKTHKANILLVEDDTNLGYVIQDNLKMNKYAVNLYIDGQAALKAFLNNSYDICILDDGRWMGSGNLLAGVAQPRKNLGLPFLCLVCCGPLFRSNGRDFLGSAILQVRHIWYIQGS